MTHERARLGMARLIESVERNPGGPEFPLLAEAHRRRGRLDEARRVAVAGLAANPDDGVGRLALGLTLLDLGEHAAARYELERAIDAMNADGLDEWLPTRDGDSTFSAGSTLSGLALEMLESGSTLAPDFESSLDDVDLDSFPDIDAVGALPPVVPGSDITDELMLDDGEFERAFAGAESLPDEMVDANQIAEAAMLAESLDAPEGFATSERGTFATETMARLLEEQGDRAGADAIRARLAAQDDCDPAPETEPRMTAASFAGLDAAQAADATAFGFSGGLPESERIRILTTLETWLQNLRRTSA